MSGPINSDACEAVRPLLSRYSEGEIAPWDAMRVARHVPDCTACRIVLARERRLARLLGEDLEDLPVGDEFVARVMETLAHEPPPTPRRRFRGLKLAVFAGLACLLGGAGWGLGVGTQTASATWLPSLPSGAAEGVLAGLSGILRLAPRAADGLTLTAPLAGASLIKALGATVTVVCAGVALAGCLAAALVVAGHALTRRLL